MPFAGLFQRFVSQSCFRLRTLASSIYCLEYYRKKWEWRNVVTFQLLFLRRLDAQKSIQPFQSVTRRWPIDCQSATLRKSLISNRYHTAVNQLVVGSIPTAGAKNQIDVLKKFTAASPYCALGLTVRCRIPKPMLLPDVVIGSDCKVPRTCNLPQSRRSAEQTRLSC